ncbi:MAG: prolyl oligopeptidase family serine peptidase [Elusimicrobiota bacterium]|jgi:prolyl oligopeptidase
MVPPPLTRLALILLLSQSAASLALGGSYPATRTVEVSETFHGTEVKDPYRWLEEMTSEEVHRWVLKQNEAARALIDQVPERERIRKRLTELWNYERYSVPEKHGKRYFYTHNSGLQNQPVFFVSEDLRNPEKVLLDPNTLSPDGTISVSKTSVSRDGELFAYALSRSGSDQLEWKVRDVSTGKDLQDSILKSKHAPVRWAHDGSGFYYLKFEESGINRLYFHLLGAPQVEDKIVYEHPSNKKDYITPQISEDGRYLILFVHGGSSKDTRVYFADLKASGDAPRVLPIVEKAEGRFSFLGNIGARLIFHTSLDAPRGRIVSIDTSAAPYGWKTLVAEGADTIQEARLVNHRLILAYIKNATARLRVFDENGKPTRDAALPVPLSGISALVGNPSDERAFFQITSLTTPSSVFSLDPISGEASAVWKLKLLFEPGDFTATQVFFTSKDGTKVPMTIARKKGVPLDGSAPTILYGYGGFNYITPPSFSVRNIQWMEMGGIYAYANIRGGGEYGEAWHQAGIKTRKQNVFDDFIAAAEWLIAGKYTSTPKLAISGSSNGGLLVGACMTQRPDLFGAALPDVGVLDMLRFQMFTEGPEWTVDYGEIAKPEEFKALLAYSPYHNIRPGTAYPPALITASESDDRVVPAHSYKFAARLQAAQSGENPILLRIETKAGHGAGTPTSKMIEKSADVGAFLIKALNIKR